ncbi:MAG: aminotransferase class I/II-fold pyridoxal phosphate-dependent enzyme [Acidimicrobiales bacterium]
MSSPAADVRPDGIHAPYVPPPYPYDRLDAYKPLCDAFEGGCVDLSTGTPVDPPLPAAVEALSHSDAERGYPPSIGTLPLRQAISRWIDRRFGVQVDPKDTAACIGTKEFVASLPNYLKLRRPDRDTVLYPEIAYPTYEMGATFARCRAVPVPVDEHFRIRLDAIDPVDAARALVLWVNTPGNPAGGLDDLAAAAAWGRERDIPVFSDECYAEFTWQGPPRTILSAGVADGFKGLVAVHSLSKRSNFAGCRLGFYAGDPELVYYLQEVRKHGGMMVPGPVQAAGIAALDDDEHVEHQRKLYHDRLLLGQAVFARLGVPAPMPAGGFYLWIPAPDGDAWALTERLAREAGALISPGEFYGEAGKGFVRVAMVQPDDKLRLVAERVGV